MTPTDLEARLERMHADSFGWALNCCEWNETEAEDVLHDAYVKVLSGRARYGGRSTFRTWLFGVIRLTAAEGRRRAGAERRRTLRLVDPSEAAGRGPSRGDAEVSVPPEDAVSRIERSRETRRLVEAMRQVSDRQREVLHLVFYQELSIADAARVMGVSVGSARKHYSRGKDRLRALLGPGDATERHA